MGLADAVSVGLFECRRGRIVWANRRLAELAGAEAAEALVGRGPDALLSDAGEGIPDWLGGEGDGGALPPAIECALVREDGVRLVVRIRPLGQGTWEMQDVSRERALAAEVHHLGTALLAARREGDAVRERLERESKEREDLLSVVSHELQTPLTVMAGFTRLLLSEEAGPLNRDQRHFLCESAKSCRRLSDFIANLMEAQGDRAVGRALELADASLAHTIENVVELLRPLVKERRQHISFALHPDAGRARFDPVRIEQVLINLLGNALKYGRPEGQITISTRCLEARRRRFVEVAVADDGPGVRLEDRERIFEPYVRAPGAGDGTGLGLGLAICKRIVEAHGGVIGVGPAPGGGSRFAFTLEAVQDREGC